MSTISRDEVARLAKLARLALTDAELDSFAGQLDAIIGYVGQIQACDVSGVEPSGNQALSQSPGATRGGHRGTVNVTRQDVAAPSLTQQQALAEAPSAEDGRFVVPQILGDEA